MEEDHYSKEFDEAPMPHSIFFTKIGHAIHGTDSVNRLGSPASHGCIRLSRENAAKLFALVKEQGVLNTTVTLSGSSQVALARNPRPRANTAVARRAPLPQYEQQQYDSAGDPVVITPQQQRVAPQARADDGYIYPADGSSNEARYPAPGRRVYDTQAYQQQQPQQQYYDNRGYAPAPQGYYYQPRQILSAARTVHLSELAELHCGRGTSASRDLSRPSHSPAGARVAPSAATVARRRAPSSLPPLPRRRR